jgi:hypothetical protein
MLRLGLKTVQSVIDVERYAKRGEEGFQCGQS